MDTSRTGSFIAKRRKDLGITQKELAQRLHLSDRTVSKWERGAGFPDISLIEPLADALGVTVTELLHGQEELQPVSLEAEHSARKTIQELKKGFSKNIRKAERALTILRILSVCAVMALILLALHPIRYEQYDVNEISPARALKICPFSVITGDEYRLISHLMSDEKISGLFADDALYIFTPEDIHYLKDGLLVNGEPPDTVQLIITGHSLTISYLLEDESCALTYDITTERFLKVSAEYRPFGVKPRYTIENTNNTTFKQIMGSRDLLGPIRSLFK